MLFWVYVRKFFNIFALAISKIFHNFNKKIEGVLQTKILYYKQNKVNANSMQIFYPENYTESTPIIFYFHGGGWIEFDKSIYRTLCRRLSSFGAIVVNTNYRLSPRVKLDGILKNCSLAINFGIDYIKENFNNNANKIFLAGDSAGAQISSNIAVQVVNKNPEFVCDNFKLKPKDLRGLILCYGVYDFTTVIKTKFPHIKLYTRATLGKNYKKQDVQEKYSILNKINENFPPSILVSGAIDKLHASQSLALAKILDDMQIYNKQVFFPKKELLALHGFMNIDGIKTNDKALKEIHDFINVLIGE